VTSSGRSTERHKAIVTGGAGFIGSHLVDALRGDGWAVLVVDDLSTGRADRLPPDTRLEVRDIATDDLTSIVRTWRPRALFHLAAQSSVPASEEDPLRDLAVNVVGTIRVAEAAVAASTERFVFASSGGAVYGETGRAATERTVPAPASAYGIHKLAAEGHVRRAGLSHAIVRPSNVYGPGQAAGLEGAVVASFFEQVAAGGPLRIHGDGRQVRDFIHVADAVAAMRLLAASGRESGAWNVSTGRAVAIAELADAVEAAVGRSVGRSSAPRRSGDVSRSVISSARLRRLGWRPAITLERGLRELAGGPAAA
jgi:UDP-glucose 4-epimerase